MPKAPENLREFEGLIKVVEFLRGPDGCPWDKEQTHETLTRFAIEEAHELADAIDSGDVNEIRDELGDVLLQVVLHAEIAANASDASMVGADRVTSSSGMVATIRNNIIALLKSTGTWPRMKQNSTGTRMAIVATWPTVP